MVNPPSPPLDLAVIGAGLHALTLVTHLLQKRQTMGDRFLVFDPWRQQFAVLDIPYLRSRSAAASRRRYINLSPWGIVPSPAPMRYSFMAGDFGYWRC